MGIILNIVNIFYRFNFAQRSASFAFVLALKTNA